MIAGVLVAAALVLLGMAVKAIWDASDSPDFYHPRYQRPDKTDAGPGAQHMS